jgi:hypothetical protein
MTRPQVADGGDALHVWRAAAHILNKQLRTADKRWSCGLGLGVGLTTTHRKNKPITKVNKKPRTWTDSLDKRPKRKKMDMRFENGS